MTSLLTPPPTSPTDIQSHLYTSFLGGKTADVAVHVHGSWEALYKLHRVVLIQAGFFRALFDGGFSEAAPRMNSHFVGPSEVKVVFPDPNITRAAFELCIARLYGGGPPLFISPDIIPTSKQPLTPAFPPSIFTKRDRTTRPALGQQLCTPRFLLSLLATSIYLSVPTLASEALGLVLSTVGPTTVNRYLNFAIGKGIGDACDDDPETVLGLENVAQIIKPDTSSGIGSPQWVDVGEMDSPPDVSGLTIGEQKGPGVSISASSSDVGDDEDGQLEDNEPSHLYGAVSDRIGEAAACWLTRWGADILLYEDNTLSPALQSSLTSIGGSSAMHSSLDLTTRPDVPTVWGQGGLSAEWVVAIISSDVFFVRDEKERYDVARRVVELRRRQGIDQSEEALWVKLFRDGIYYTCMSYTDLMSIAHDVSPTTKMPFAPTSIVHGAHWEQSGLRYEITAPVLANHNSPSRSPPPREKQLGLAVTTADILGKHFSSPEWSDGEAEKEKSYHPVATDKSFIMGDNGASSDKTIPTMESLFELNMPNSKRAMRSQNIDSFFGIKASRHTAAECVTSDESGKARWIHHQPCRFGVEFWGAESLKEKARLHSRTVWYAGSLWNVYVQVVRKKGVQLGVYLHRQSSVDPAPTPSTYRPIGRFPETPAAIPRAPTLTVRPTPGRTHGRGSSLPQPGSFVPVPPSTFQNMGYSSSGLPISPPSRVNTPVSPTTPTSPHTVPSSLPGAGSHTGIFSSGTPPSSNAHASSAATSALASISQPYRDPRPAVSAYFSISCASTTGSSLMRFSSSPDVFSISQSWGWKSSSLRTEDYLQVLKEGEVPDYDAGREVSLRATVVLGLV